MPLQLRTRTVHGAQSARPAMLPHHRVMHMPVGQPTMATTRRMAATRHQADGQDRMVVRTRLDLGLMHGENHRATPSPQARIPQRRGMTGGLLRKVVGGPIAALVVVLDHTVELQPVLRKDTATLAQAPMALEGAVLGRMVVGTLARAAHGVKEGAVAKPAPVSHVDKSDTMRAIVPLARRLVHQQVCAMPVANQATLHAIVLRAAVQRNEQCTRHSSVPSLAFVNRLLEYALLHDVHTYRKDACMLRTQRPILYRTCMEHTAHTTPVVWW